MRIIVKPFPVLYACQGCAQYGQAARDAGARLDRAGSVEMVWLGCGTEPRPTQRYPVYAVDGCEERCAERWLKRHGIVPERSYLASQLGGLA